MEAAASPAQNASPAISQGEWGRPNFDVCILIQKDEIEKTQDSSVKEVLGTGRPDGDFFVSQCIYTTEISSKSVIVSVTQSNPGGNLRRTPRDFWDETMSRAAKRESEGKKKKFISLKKVDGLGEDAYWMGGALYLLKNETILRISVGGPDNEEIKIEKSKALAREGLSRLSF